MPKGVKGDIFFRPNVLMNVRSALLTAVFVIKSKALLTNISAVMRMKMICWGEDVLSALRGAIHFEYSRESALDCPRMLGM